MGHPSQAWHCNNPSKASFHSNHCQVCLKLFHLFRSISTLIVVSEPIRRTQIADHLEDYTSIRNLTKRLNKPMADLQVVYNCFLAWPSASNPHHSNFRSSNRLNCKSLSAGCHMTAGAAHKGRTLSEDGSIPKHTHSPAALAQATDVNKFKQNRVLTENSW